MADKVQKILSEIATRKLCTMDEHMAFYNDKAKEDYKFLSEIEEIIKGMQEEPVKDKFTFKAITRLLNMIEPTDKAKSYVGKLADSFDSEGYHTDAKIVRESLKIMNGEKVAIATMDEEPVSEEFEKKFISFVDATHDNNGSYSLHDFAQRLYNIAKEELKEPVSDGLEEAMQHNAPNNIGIDDLLYWRNGFITGVKWKEQKDSIISDDLEKAAIEAFKQIVDSDKNSFLEIFKAGTKWKEQQMMSKAIDGKISANGMGNPILHLWDKGRHLIDKKVKVIVIKED